MFQPVFWKWWKICIFTEYVIRRLKFRYLYQKTIFNLMLVVNFSFWLFWNQISFYLIPIFTESQEIIDKGDEVLWLVFIFVFQDFFSAAVYGFIKALNLQKNAIYINLVAHQFIILPCAYILSFYVGSNDNELMNFRGMELKGVWIAMCIGMGF